VVSLPLNSAKLRAMELVLTVKYGSRRFTCRLGGILKDNASVSPYCLIDGRRKHVAPILGPIFSVPWDKVIRAVDKHQILKLDKYQQIGMER